MQHSNIVRLLKFGGVALVLLPEQLRLTNASQEQVISRKQLRRRAKRRTIKYINHMTHCVAWCEVHGHFQLTTQLQNIAFAHVTDKSESNRHTYGPSDSLLSTPEPVYTYVCKTFGYSAVCYAYCVA